MIKIRASPEFNKKKDLNNNDHFRTEHSNNGMTFMPFLRRRLKNTQVKYFILWILSILFVAWMMDRSNHKCDENTHNFNYARLNENINDQSLLGIDTLIDRSDLKQYSRKTPLIFVGGVPRYLINL